MEKAAESDHILGLFADLPSAEAALHALQAAGTPYPAIRMGAHTANDLRGTALRAPSSGGQFWSLAVLLEPAWRDKALALCASTSPSRWAGPARQARPPTTPSAARWPGVTTYSKARRPATSSASPATAHRGW